MCGIPDNHERPQPSSLYNYVKLSFREGFSTNVVSILNDCLQQRKWELQIGAQISSIVERPPPPTIKLRTGIVGIERSLQEKQKATDESISIAFQDLSKLMAMAKDMVRLSGTISNKIKVNSDSRLVQKEKLIVFSKNKIFLTNSLT